jgi:hypothetical protein
MINMSNITITFNDGTKKEFPHEGRSGGSYSKRLILENGWVIVEDEYGNKTIYPESIVKEINERSHRGW